MSKLPLVVIILVTWNNAEDALECLASLTRLDYTNHKVVVVDNCSTDGTSEHVRRAFPHALLIENTENLGYAGGCNAGLKFAFEELGAAYCLILNNDTVVQDSHFLDLLVSSAEQDTSIGIVAPLVLNLSPSPTIQCAGVWVNYYTGRARLITRIGQRPIWTDTVHGCAFMVRREVADRVGLLDERFYLYWEETDYCVRVGKAGYRLLINPVAHILHKSGGSIGGRSDLYTYYFFRNRLLFMQKHAKSVHWLVLMPLLPLYALVHIGKSFREGHNPISTSRAIWDAWKDFRMHRFGRTKIEQL